MRLCADITHLVLNLILSILKFNKFCNTIQPPLLPVHKKKHISPCHNQEIRGCPYRCCCNSSCQEVTLSRTSAKAASASAMTALIPSMRSFLICSCLSLYFPLIELIVDEKDDWTNLAQQLFCL